MGKKPLLWFIAWKQALKVQKKIKKISRSAFSSSCDVLSAYHYQKNSTKVKTSPFVWYKASFTLEAAACLPVFAMFLVIVLLFFYAFEVEYKIEKIMIQQARVATLLSLANQDHAVVPLVLSSCYVAFYEEDIIRTSVQGGARGIVFKQAVAEEGYLKLTVEYQMNLLGFFPVQSPIYSKSINYSLWQGEIIRDKEQIEYVFLTPEGEVYHITRLCTYLNPSVNGVLSANIKELRNSSGGIYYPCSCLNKENLPTKVYITDYGSRYHFSNNCGYISRNVQKVPITQVEGRRCCKKCEGT